MLHLQREMARLELEQLRRKNPPLSEEDMQRMRDLEDELDRLEYEMLLQK